MSVDLFKLLGRDPDSASAVAARDDVRQHERLIDTLRDLRRTRGLTQAQVAKAMGTHQSVVSDLESLGNDPRLSTVQRYARAVGAHVRLGAVADAQVPASDGWQSVDRRHVDHAAASYSSDDEELSLPLFVASM